MVSRSSSSWWFVMSTTNLAGKQEERFAWTLGSTRELVWKPSRRLRSIWGNPAEKEVDCDGEETGNFGRWRARARD